MAREKRGGPRGRESDLSENVIHINFSRRRVSEWSSLTAQSGRRTLCCVMPIQHYTAQRATGEIA